MKITTKGSTAEGLPRAGGMRPGPRRTGSVEPGRRADGTTYYRARIRLADDSRVRVDVPAKYAVAAGGMIARERAEALRGSRAGAGGRDGRAARGKAYEGVVGHGQRLV